MRVLLSHPYFWPHVLRGAEREVHDVGTGLAARGHDVRLLTGQPSGLTSTTRYGGMRVRYVRSPLPAALRRRGVSPEAAFAPFAAAGAAFSGADVVVSYHYADAYGVEVADRAVRRRRPHVLKLTGAVPRWYLDQHGTRTDQALLRRALDRADEVWVNSPYVAEAMADWGVPMQVVPAGIDDAAFVPCADRAAEPVVLCTAAPEEPRKRLPDLLDAWPAVLDALPGARLELAQEVSAPTREALLGRVPEQLRDTVSFLGRLAGQDLAEAYSRAWVTVAPAAYEALGLATLEALACGTPVAGARSGATPWLLEVAGTGALYEPGDTAGLAAAVVKGAGLAQVPTTRDTCRAAAQRFAWPGILDDVERRLESLVR
ncbi:MAG TPA: glycosyltransferase family 4 protein [Mycobacteriales bacterium]|nr:glycosyltransferase family 4 protein [Mycobacteriales bacterium]